MLTLSRRWRPPAQDGSGPRSRRSQRRRQRALNAGGSPTRVRLARADARRPDRGTATGGPLEDGQGYPGGGADAGAAHDGLPEPRLRLRLDGPVLDCLSSRVHSCVEGARSRGHLFIVSRPRASRPPALRMLPQPVTGKLPVRMTEARSEVFAKLETPRSGQVWTLDPK